MANPNRKLDQGQVIDRLPDEVKAEAYTVGNWVWIETNLKEKPAIRQALKDLGFHYSKRRTAWQHPCGHFSGKSYRDPRQKYGVMRIKTDDKQPQLAIA